MEEQNKGRHTRRFQATKNATPTGDGWFTVISRQARQQLTAKQQGKHAYRKQRTWQKQVQRLSPRNPQQQYSSIPRQMHHPHLSFRTHSSQQAKSMHHNRYSYHPMRTNKTKKGIKCNGTIPEIFPVHFTSAIKAINGCITPQATTNWVQAQLSNHKHLNYHNPTIYNTKIHPATLMAQQKQKQNLNVPLPINSTPTTHPLTHNRISTYSQIAKSPLQSQPKFPPNNHRFHSPPWPHYLDSSPWQLQTISPASQILTKAANPPSPLPLPPDPASPAWRGRCYNCLERGHDQSSCLSIERVCAQCWKKGHEAKNCITGHSSVQLLNPLTPRGNMGAATMPLNRPKVISVFIPETAQMRHNALELNRALVIDAKLRPKHDLNILQSVLMNTCKSEYPLPITHMSGAQYLLFLPMGHDRHRFIEKFGKDLENLGYVTYIWTPAINGYPLNLKYKVWIELRRLPPQAWCIEYLIAAISSFGIVLDHSPMNRVQSLESMTAVIAVPELDGVPEAVRMWIRAISRDIEVVILSWIEEPLPVSQFIDPTPSDTYFKSVQQDNITAATSFKTDLSGQGIVSIGFETLLSVWEQLQPGEEKDSIEATLRTNPDFESRCRHKGQKNPTTTTPLATAPSHPPAIAPSHPPATAEASAAHKHARKFTAQEKAKNIVSDSAMENSIPLGTGELIFGTLNMATDIPFGACTFPQQVQASVHAQDLTVLRGNIQNPISNPNPNPTAVLPTSNTNRSFSLPNNSLLHAQNIPLPAAAQNVAQLFNTTHRLPTKPLDLNITPTFPHSLNNTQTVPPSNPIRTHRGSNEDPIPISPSLSDPIMEPATCDDIQPDHTTTKSEAPVATITLLNQQPKPVLPQFDPMEEEPSEYFPEESENEETNRRRENEAMDYAAALELELELETNYANLSHAQDRSEQMGSNSGEKQASPMPYQSESSKSQWEVEMIACGQEWNSIERLREEEAAYQSALADPSQAHLLARYPPAATDLAPPADPAPMAGPTPPASPPLPLADPIPALPQIPPSQADPIPPAPAEIGNSAKPRRSDRIFEKKITKQQSPKKCTPTKKPTPKKNTPGKNKPHKTTPAKKGKRAASPSGGIPKLQARLLQALSDEALDANPLQQHMADQVDYVCGIKNVMGATSGVDPTEAVGTNSGVIIDKGKQLGVDDMNESVLGAFDSDSDYDLSDDEGRSGGAV